MHGVGACMAVTHVPWPSKQLPPPPPTQGMQCIIKTTTDLNGTVIIAHDLSRLDAARLVNDDIVNGCLW